MNWLWRHMVHIVYRSFCHMVNIHCLNLMVRFYYPVIGSHREISHSDDDFGRNFLNRSRNRQVPFFVQFKLLVSKENNVEIKLKNWIVPIEKT